MVHNEYSPIDDWSLARPWAKQNPAWQARPNTMEVLTEAVEGYARSQPDRLELCRHIASASCDPMIDLIMQAISDDLERHAVLLRRTVATMRCALTWTHSPDELPSPRLPANPINSGLLIAARAEIRAHRLRARALRNLAAGHAKINAGLNSMLLEMMALDAEKHARLLRFVVRRLGSRTALEAHPPDECVDFVPPDLVAVPSAPCVQAGPASVGAR